MHRLPALVTVTLSLVAFSAAAAAFEFEDAERGVFFELDEDWDICQLIPPPEEPDESCAWAREHPLPQNDEATYVVAFAALEMQDGIATFLVTALGDDDDGAALRLDPDGFAEGVISGMREGGVVQFQAGDDGNYTVLRDGPTVGVEVRGERPGAESFLIRAYGGRGGVITLTISTTPNSNATPGLIAEQTVLAVEPPTQDALSRQSSGYGVGYTIGIVIVWGVLGLIVIAVGVRLARKGQAKNERS